ncbi:Versiconal hemiacetal acetate reductase, partial [Leucoagaricus sp. SymC.cos]
IMTVRVGNSGLKVSKIIHGCMSYGSKGWAPWVLPEEEGIKQIKFAYVSWINAFDTADAYSNGMSEAILGKAIKQHNLPRDELVIMTKTAEIYAVVNRDMNGPPLYDTDDAERNRYTNQFGLSRKHIFAAVKACLERLQLDYIDLLQCHRFDPNTPVEETMQALHDVVQAGYVRYIGMSSCYAYQCYALQNKLTPFISMQNHYSLLYREEEREMFPTLKHFGVGAIAWSPLARGVLCRPFASATTERMESDSFIKFLGLDQQSNKAIVDRVEELARKKGVTMAQIATAWCLIKPGVTASIIGSTSIQNLQEAIDAIKVKLTHEDVKHLEELYTSRAVAGHV